MLNGIKKITWNIRFFVVCLLAALVALCFVGCKKDAEGGGTPPSEDVGFALTQTVAELDIDDTLLLETKSGNLSGTVVWTSADESVVTVSNGLVTPVGEGITTVTATLHGYSASCMIRVYNSKAAPTLALNVNDVTIGKGETFTVQTSLTYKGEDISADAQYVWALADGGVDGVAKLTADGKNAVVEGSAYGTTKYVVAATVRDLTLTESFSVTVRDAGIVLDIPQLTPVKGGGYETDLYTTNAGGYYKNLPIAVNVYENGALIENAQVEFSSENAAIAKMENGMLVGLDEGQTVITARYNDSVVSIVVYVVKPTFTLAQKALFEVGDLQPYVAEEPLAGEITDVTIGGTSVYGGASAGGFTLSAEKLNALSLDNYGEARAFVIETTEALYALTADLYSLVIESAEDYARWGEVSLAAGYEKDGYQYWGGYFVMGANLAKDGGIPMNQFIDRLNAKVGGPNGDKGGFVGVFDGRGYNIDGLYKTDTGIRSGFIGIMSAGSVLKNVSFTNATFDDTQGCFIAFGGAKATVENLYIEYAKILNSDTSTNLQGATFFGGNNGGVVPTNCFIDASRAEISGDGYKFKLIGKGEYKGFGCLYPVDATSVEGVLGGQPWGTRCTATNIAAMQNDTAYQTLISKYDTSFWTVLNGVPVPKKLYEEVYAKDEAIGLAKAAPETVEVGGSYRIHPNRNYVILSADNGVKVEGNTLIIPENTTIGTEITVCLTSVFNSENTYTFTAQVVEPEPEYVAPVINLDIQVVDGVAVLNDETFSVTVGKASDDFGEVESVLFGEKELDASKFSVENGVLSAPLSVFGFDTFGVEDLFVEFCGGQVVQLPDTTVISKVIKTVEAYASWTVISKAAGYTSGGYQYWSGYFQLGANLSQEGGIALNEGIHRDLVGSASGAAGGFAGTFDGCGYTIDGLTKNSDLKSGFVGVIAGGTLKNIAFTNAVYNGAQGGLISFAGRGTYEDIYVSYASVSGVVAGNYAGTFDVGNSGSTMKRVFVDAENTVWDESSKVNFDLVGKGNYAEGLYGVDNRLSGGLTWPNEETTGSISMVDSFFRFESTVASFETFYNNTASSYYMAVSAWLTACESWTVVNGAPIFKAMVK